MMATQDIRKDILRPADAAQLREIVADAGTAGRPIEIVGGGSKRDIGNPRRETSLVDLRALAGVVDYEPSELVLTVRPATPLAEIEALLASRNQMLAFEPWDHGPLFGRPSGAATIGGIVAAGVAGARRVSAGGARDHLLGFAAVSGRAELFKGGGKVVKNVTGYDISKVMAGSWGQLAIMTELTLKVMPAPKSAVTVALDGLPTEAAVAAMSKALGSPSSPAAAAFVPSHEQGRSITLIRVEGFAEAVAARVRQLSGTLAAFAEPRLLESGEAAALWASLREVSPLAGSEALWRIHVAPSRAAAITAALDAGGAAWHADWAGALMWAGASADLDVRSIATSLGAHAMLVRGPADLRSWTPARQPQAPAVAALSARLKAAFDPAGILDPERFG
jgi:glycolate oxidase FAD binding subunit